MDNKKVPLISLYECPLCNSTMPIQNKNQHELFCKKNQEDEKMNEQVCIICFKSIKNSEYVSHFEAHFHSEDPCKGPSLSSKIETIPCEICKKNIEIASFGEHMKLHQTRRKPIVKSHADFLYKIISDVRRSPSKKDLPKTPVKTSRLPKTTYQGKGDKKECGICLNDFKLNEKLITLPCFHLFHEGCMLTWLESKEECPICKMKVNAA